MALLMSAHLMGSLEELRFQPTPKRVRAALGGLTVVDSTRAQLIWEPRRVVPSYAVPEADLLAEVRPSTAGPVTTANPVVIGHGPPILDPSTSFDVHTAEGERLTVRSAGEERVGAAFRLADAELANHVVLDFDAFDSWLEEDEAILGHPRDPFARIDVRRTSRHVVVELYGVVLADTTRARALFETHLPLRFYLPRQDVLATLRPTATTTVCAYKGVASYWSVEVDGRPVEDVAWSYERPLEEMAVLSGLVSFFSELTDFIVDGQRQERPRSPWSEPTP